MGEPIKREVQIQLMVNAEKRHADMMRRWLKDGGAMSNRSFKVRVCFESRDDGGLRAWSPDLPGFVLSHSNIDALLADVEPAIKTIIGYRLRAEAT